MEYLKATGKTQKQIDDEKTEEVRVQEVSEAKARLAATDYQIIKAAETLLVSSGLLDAKIVEERIADRLIASQVVSSKESAP